MSEKLREFKKLLGQKMDDKIPVQTEWVKVQSINTEENTMVAIGEQNGLEYHDVLLGLGSVVIVPKVGSLAIVGSIHNGEACYLIYAEEIDGYIITDSTGFKLSLNNGLMTINGEEFGGIVNAIELKQQLDKNTLILQKIQEAFANWITVPNDGGAALKGLSSTFSGLNRADLSQIQNNKIKHGNG